MRLISLSRCKEGTELAKSIYDNNGLVLLAEGYKLTFTGRINPKILKSFQNM